MAWKAPSMGDLRHRVRFDRQDRVSDDMGGFVSTWEPLVTVSAQVLPARGGEDVRAARVSGMSGYDIVIRSDSTTRTLTTGDRAVDTRSGKTLNVRWVGDLEGRDRFLVCVCESGGLTDE